MKNAILTAIIMLCLNVIPLWAELPDTIQKGLDIYKESGFPDAMRFWLKGTALEGDTTSKLSTVGGIAQIEAAYGKYQAFELLADYNVSTRLKRVYLVLYYQRGPVFAYFDLFKMEKEWKTYMFLFNTKPQEILPRDLIDKKGG